MSRARDVPRGSRVERLLPFGRRTAQALLTAPPSSAAGRDEVRGWLDFPHCSSSPSSCGAGRSCSGAGDEDDPDHPMPVLAHMHMNPEHPVPGIGDGALLAELPPPTIDELIRVGPAEEG